MKKVVSITKYRRKPKQLKFITCPVCKKQQCMEYNTQDDVWFPIVPFCCDVMRNSDTMEWNALLDKALGY